VDEERPSPLGENEIRQKKAFMGVYASGLKGRGEEKRWGHTV